MRLELAEEDGIAPRDRAEGLCPLAFGYGPARLDVLGTCAVADVGLVDGPAELIERQP